MAGQIVRTASAVLFFFNALFFRFKLYYAVLSAMQGQGEFLRLTPIVTLAARPARNFLLNKKSCSRRGWSHSLSRLLPHFAANSKERVKMKWFVLFFSDDTENEYFKGTEQEAKNAFADKKVIEIWECNNDETLSLKRRVKP